MNPEIPLPDWQLPDRFLVRIAIAVAGSLLFHGFLLSLQFGVFGLGLPGLTLPWNEHRASVSELSIWIANAEKSSQTSNQIEEPKPESIKPPTQTTEPTGGLQAVPLRRVEPALIIPTPATTSAQIVPAPPAPRIVPPNSEIKAVPLAEKPVPQIEKSNPPEAQLLKQEIPQPKVISKLDTNPDTFTVPQAATTELQPLIAPKVETTIQSADALEKKKVEEQEARLKEQAQVAHKLAEENAKRDRERELRLQEEANAKRQALELEAQKQAEQAAAAKIEAAALALQKQEQAALKAKEERKAKEEAIRQAQQLEALRLEEIKKQELAKLELAKQEQIKQEEEKLKKEKQLQEKIKQQALELEAKRQAEEAARQKALAMERQKQADELAAKVQEQQKAQELAERKQREAVAAQQQRERERIAAEAAASAARNVENNKPTEPANLPRNYSGSDLASRAYEQVKKLDLNGLDSKFRPSTSSTTNSPRRRSIFGSVDKEFDLSMYIENWRQKIERNGRLNYKQTSIEKAVTNPLVTVAIRSDGSVEDIIINRSSGRPELDEAVRRIVRLNARYSAFPPNLAREYDVIEIRRVWSFDETLRVLEEGR